MKLTKTIFRKNCIKTLHSLSKHNRLYRNKKINFELYKLLYSIKNKNILFYYPFGFEVDIRDTLKKVRKTNKVYIPFMQCQSFKMVPFRLPLIQGKYGIFQSGNTLRKIDKVDIVIVPIIGIDKNFQRIGFGKGMYDRFFSTLKKKPYTIFLQSKRCFTNKNICDPYDISCDLLLTFDGMKIKNKNRKKNVI